MSTKLSLAYIKWFKPVAYACNALTGLLRVVPVVGEGAYGFIELQSIERACHMISTFVPDNQEECFVNDLVDVDMYLRLNESAM